VSLARQLKELLKSLRPHQWTKNLVVLAALIFAERLFDRPSVIAAASAFVIFCLLSGAVYLVNDLVDVEYDRRHPVKRHRPLASGKLTRSVAVAATVVLVAGGLIALAGYLVSTLIRDVVTATVESTGSNNSELFGLGAQGAVFLTAVVIGLDQVGIDVTLLIVLLALVVGGIMLSFVFAFGFGAQSFVGNLIGAQQAQSLLEPGQTAAIDGVTGQVLEITPTSVVLLTAEGKLVVPARLFIEKSTLVYSEHDDDA